MQDVYLVSEEGGESTRLTDDSRNVYGHAWSPDGRGVLFSSNRSGRVELWRVPASGGAPSWVGLGDGQALFPSVSPESGRLAYLQNASEVNIWQVRIGEDDSAAPLIASTQWDLHPQVSPDGRRVAFASNRSGSYEVWVSDRDGRGATRLTDFGGTFTSTPRWSPDGQSLVFTARPEGQADLYTIGVEGAVPRRLTTEASDEMAAGWSSDGQWVYFSSNRSGAWEVWKVPAGGGAAEQVTRRGGFGPQASPDGRFLYYARHKEAGLWRMPVEGGSESRVLEALQPADWGSWAVHGDGVYFVQRGRPPVLAFHNFATGRTDTVFVPPGGIPAMDPALAVTPDGAWLLFGQVDRTEQDLMLVEGIR
jgi:Tol biopolymer transport system component